jgi:hypothetical protein
MYSTVMIVNLLLISMQAKPAMGRYCIKKNKPNIKKNKPAAEKKTPGVTLVF